MRPLHPTYHHPNHSRPPRKTLRKRTRKDRPSYSIVSRIIGSKKAEKPSFSSNGMGTNSQRGNHVAIFRRGRSPNISRVNDVRLEPLSRKCTRHTETKAYGPPLKRKKWTRTSTLERGAGTERILPLTCKRCERFLSHAKDVIGSP